MLSQVLPCRKKHNHRLLSSGCSRCPVCWYRAGRFWATHAQCSTCGGRRYVVLTAALRAVAA